MPRYLSRRASAELLEVTARLTFALTVPLVTVELRLGGAAVEMDVTQNLLVDESLAQMAPFMGVKR